MQFEGLNGGADLEPVPIFQAASQEYRHEYSGHRRQKVFNDSVHGHFQLHRASVAIIDTPEFQRLRNLKQLGLAYKIFPGASHNRFEHSLGVAHLASDWGAKLISSRDGVGEDGWQMRRLEPEDRQHLTVLQLAGGWGAGDRVCARRVHQTTFQQQYTACDAARASRRACAAFDRCRRGTPGTGAARQERVRAASACVHASAGSQWRALPHCYRVAAMSRLHAGLTHDLGHGPFSHVFEKELLPRLGLAQDVVKNWEHETMSNRILDHLLNDPENDIDLQDLARLDEDHVVLIKRLMHGSKNPEQEYPTAPWLFDVVANKRTGADADRFDYLKRDSMMCGVAVPLDAKRLMLFSRLSPDRSQIVFKQTEYHNLAVGLFQSRAEMHRRVYTHQKIKSVEFMVCDSVALVAGPLGLRDAICSDADLQAYLNLDDSLLQTIKMLVPERHEKPADVIKAQALLQQLERRKLYKYVSEVTLDVNAQQRYTPGCKPTAEEIVSYQSTAQSGVNLNPDDVIVCEIHIDQGMKAQNPMLNVKFYQTSDPEGGDEPFTMPQEQVTSMLGSVYQDKIIRVYSKNADPAVIKALKYAFTQWSDKRHNCQPPGTPWRQQPVYQQPLPRAPPSIERVGGRAAGAAGLAQNMFRSAADSNGNSNSNGDAQQQHMGSGGRSRKRSLTQDMAAASQGSQGSEQPAKYSRGGGSSSQLPDIAEEDGH